MRFTILPTLRVVSLASPPILLNPRNCRFTSSAGVPAPLFFPGRVQQRRTLRQIATQRLCCRVAQRDEPLLLTFAAYQDRFVGPVNIPEIQPRQLCVPNAAAVKQFENRPVARRPTGGVRAH